MSKIKQVSKKRTVGTMIVQAQFSTAVVQRFKAFCASKGLSLSAGVRLAVSEMMEGGKYRGDR